MCRIRRRQCFRFTAGVGAFGVSTATHGVGVEPVLRLRIARYNINPSQWPAGFQLKIAAIADLHACDPWMSIDRIHSIVDRTNALGADIIVLLGDYLAGHPPVTRLIPAGDWAPVLAAFKPPPGVPPLPRTPH